MNLCKLTEIKTIGRHSTWNNKQDGEDRVFSRIDRVLANAEWEDMKDTIEAAFLPKGGFDHYPMVLSCYTSRPQEEAFQILWYVEYHSQVH